jgi:hypothetical protein
MHGREDAVCIPVYFLSTTLSAPFDRLAADRPSPVVHRE